MDLSLLGATKSKVLTYLLERRRTAGELSGLLQIQISAVRKHLEDLRESGIVSEVFSKQGLGRPKKYYALTQRGREMFPRKYEVILSAVLEKLKGNKKSGARIVNEIASELVEQLEIGPDVIGEKHLHSLVQRMNNFGFFSSLRSKGDGVYEITSRNCPFYLAAKADPNLFCNELHTEMIRQATDSKEIDLSRCMVMGDEDCTHVISTKWKK